MRFELQPSPQGEIVREHKSFWFWGLTPMRTIDVQQKCPNGVVAIKEETTFRDGLCDAVTLGIWSPRSSYYYCRPPARTE